MTVLPWPPSAVAHGWRAYRQALPLLPWALAVLAFAWVLVVAAFAAGRGEWFGHDAAPAPLVAGWLVMTVATMGPSALPIARYLAANTLVPGRAVAAYASGYLAAWAAFLAAFGLVDLAAHAVATPGAGGAGGAAAFTVAAGWQLTPYKRAALRTCRLVRVPPAHRGRAERFAARLGLRHGGACVVSCGPLMLAAMAAAAGRLPLLAAVAVLAWAEKAGGAGRRLARPSAAVLGAVAVAHAVAG